MEYSIDEFVATLREMMYDNFPLEPDKVNDSKHPNRKGKHMRDIAFKDLPITVNLETRTFDIGSPMAEAIVPQYHILQNSEVIKKRGRGTTTSKGSQDKEQNLLMRDYERIFWNGKTYSKEYTKNVRGSRSKASKISAPKLRYRNGEYIPMQSNSYVNVHYRYIDRILDTITPWLADTYGMRLGRKQDTGLEEEYNMQESESSIIGDILESFD